MRRKNDMLWKGLIQEVVEDLLRFVEPDIDKELDLTRGFEFLDKELEQMYPEPAQRSHTRVVDKLVKVFSREGGERWLLLHIEVQGRNEPGFPKRMFQYYYRLLERHDRPVAAIAVLTGRDGKQVPSRYEDRCLWTREIYEYKTLCIIDYPDEVLMASKNLFALVIMVAKEALLQLKGDNQEKDNRLLEQKLLIVKLLQERKDLPECKVAAIMTFLNNYVSFKKPETNRIFEKKVDQLTGKENTMDIFEQVAEIRAKETAKKLRKVRKEGNEKAVKLLLVNTKLSIGKIAAQVGVSELFVKRVKANMKS